MEYIIFFSIAIIITIIITLIYKKYLTLIIEKKEEYRRLQSATETLVNERYRINKDIQTGENLLKDICNKVDFADQALKDLNQQYDTSFEKY